MFKQILENAATKKALKVAKMQVKLEIFLVI